MVDERDRQLAMLLYASGISAPKQNKNFESTWSGFEVWAKEQTLL